METCPRWLPWCAGLLAGVMLFAGLGAPPLMQPDEARNAEVAREMKDADAWLVPTYNCLPYLDKPAFFFKTVALSFAAFGESEAAARLPSAISAAVLLALVFAFCRREYGMRPGAMALLIIATMPLYLAFARLVIFDMMLALFVCTAIFSGYIAEQHAGLRRRMWYLAGTVAAAFATLVKGPVGFIVPALVLLVFNCWDHRRGAWKRMLAPLNLLVFFALVLPWFIALTREHPDFAYYGLVKESFRRYTTSEFRRTGAVYYYLPWVVGGCFAWSALWPESIVAAWRARTRLTSADRLFLVWTVVVVIFFTLSQSKRPDYILTVTVSLGVLTARVFELALTNHDRARRVVLRGTMLMAALSSCLTVVAALYLGHTGNFLHFLDNRYPWVQQSAPLVLAIGIATALSAWVVWRKRRMVPAFVVFILFPCATICCTFPGFVQYAEYKSARGLAREINGIAPGADVVCVRCFATGLPFYLKRCVTVMTADGNELTSNYIVYWLARQPRWPENVVPLTETNSWLATRSRPALFLGHGGTEETLDALAESHGTTDIDLQQNWSVALLPPTGGT